MANRDKIKTQPTDGSVNNFLLKIKDDQQKKDAQQLRELMHKVTGKPATMWGSSIIGFGSYHYKYASGREGDMCAVGFSPRSSSLTIYLVDGTAKYSKILDKLGPHKTGKACLYIKRMSDVDVVVLEDLIKESYRYVLSRKNDMHRAE